MYIHRILADVVVLVHLGFVGFVIAGGLLVFRWRKAMWLHLPAAAWGALIEFAGWVCPLTPLENWLRRQAGEEIYRGGFVEHYIVPLLYPGDLTRTIQIVLGISVIAVNAVIYWFALRRSSR